MSYTSTAPPFHGGNTGSNPARSSTKFARRRSQSAKTLSQAVPAPSQPATGFEGAGQIFRSIVLLVKMVLLAPVLTTKPDYSAYFAIQKLVSP